MNNDGMWVSTSEGAPSFVPKFGDKYRVTIEEEVYESTLMSLVDLMNLIGEEHLAYDGYLLGNPAFVGDDLDEIDNGETFALLFMVIGDGDEKVTIGLLDSREDLPREGDNYRVSIYGQIASVQKLDEIYMPESYSQAKAALKELVPQVETNTSNITTNRGLIDSINNQIATVLKYSSQTLTEAQKTQARKNIGAISASEVPESVQADLSETDSDSPAYVKGVLRYDSIPLSVPTTGKNYYFDVTKGKVSLPLTWTAAGGVCQSFGKTPEGVVLALQELNKSPNGLGFTLITEAQVDSVLQCCPLYAEWSGDGIMNRGNYLGRNIVIIIGSNSYGVIVEGETIPEQSMLVIGALYMQISCREHRYIHESIVPSTIARLTDVTDQINTVVTPDDIDAICGQSLTFASEVTQNG